MAAQTISLPRPMVKVYFPWLVFACEWREGLVGYMYHAMAGVVRVGVDDAVGGGIVTSCVHGIGASLVEGGLFCC